FHGSVRARISDAHMGASWALETEAKDVIERLEASRSPYLNARAEDIRDLVGSLLEILSGEGAQRKRERVPGQATDSLVHVSGHLCPSQVIDARARSSVAFATESAALLSHAAILLRGFGIPSVGGVIGLRESVHDGDLMIVDATNGVIIVRPDRSTVQEYEALVQQAGADDTAPFPRPEGGRTRDGVAIRLMGNIDNPVQVGLVRRQRLEGIGLFRTEFMVMEAGRIPSEQEQYETYRRVIQRADGSSIVIRTFDLGADKQMPDLHRCTGQNPALGIRGVRRHLRLAPDELKVQMRAICRAAAGRSISVMVPMITTVDEVRLVKRHLRAVRATLRAEGTPCSDDVRLGVMIEVPAAALAVGEILDEVDFVSVGSNDLLQYFMASDRDNERTVEYLDAENPGFLWLLGLMAKKARERDREDDLSICGEIASQARMIPQLLRLGFRSLSVSPAAADSARTAIASIDVGEFSGEARYPVPGEPAKE
ncbi:phosphoenolpyruvate--protein phosphotransferase, partial [bacterium]|nr:phosphoenolpyruvate--protein phosphotransferase [bacterium]